MLKMEELLNFPEEEEVEITNLYSSIRQDPGHLQAFDKLSFADTPLHLAASEGKTQLALEIQRLMPSLGRKLNPDGFIPLHLALRSGHADTATAMIKLDPQLVGVQGRGGFTPLHYVAKIGDVDALAEFLLICPDSINELTICGESAVHVGVKNRRLEAVRILVGWLKRTRRREVLGWRDWKGNTVLHLAASTNQPMVIELLIKEVSVKDKNLNGLTALDIAMELPIQENIRALQILKRKRGLLSIPKNPKFSTFADYLSSPITIEERAMDFGAYLNLGLPSQTRDSILVVAVLIATATFQAVLSPPGGFDNSETPIISNVTTAITNVTTGNVTGSGKVTMPSGDFLTFISFNSIALAASLGAIYLVLPTSPITLLLHLSLIFLMQSYLVAIKTTSPTRAATATTSIANASNFVFVAMTSIKALVLQKGSAWAFRRLIGSNYFYNIHETRILMFYHKYVS